ncbi:MAG: multidrug MFS transporter [Betaproteobacteria bacterium RIFCSPLOWO2_12_FULL_62_13b]|nr:MAG: multidrug MFS transporter [Betaproteobacteria bacterium RIFCSPLOWO2_12_FULL_62_13b]
MHIRNWMALVHDVVAAMIAWYLAYWLRFNTEIPQYNIPNMVGAMLWVVPLQAVVFFGAGMYRGMWRYASVPDLQRIALAVVLSTLAIALMLVMLPPQQPPVPRSVMLLDPMLLIMLLGGSRLGYRVWKERRLRNLLGSPGRPVVILGAGDAAADLLKNLARAGDWRVLGLLDDNPAKRGRQIQGVNVLGALDDLVALVPSLGVERAIIAMPSASHQSRRRALEICRRAGVEALTVPSYQDLMSGKVTVSQVRNIELDDLLGRDPVLLDESRLQQWIRGRSIMVTGAGGSIGSELCRQIARFEPARLVLYEHNEFALYRMEQEFAEQHPRIGLKCVIGDVKNAARVAEALAAHRPEIVFHAAAYKHVPLMEQDNAWEAIQNNVLGTWRVAEAAIAHGVEKFVLVSTDKAVNPTNVMGASKRLAEIVCQGLQAGNATRFVIVRFGNVLGSTGSVIPKFRKQIARGGPVTVTHPEITRYFMSIAEAAQLVLQAGLMGAGGEIFVLDMGEAVKIVDLARELIRLSGYGESDIGIEFIGLRPGEKLYEELLADDELTQSTPHPKLRIAKSRPAADSAWMQALYDWLQQGKTGAEQVRRELAARVPEYTPSRLAHGAG